MRLAFALLIGALALAGAAPARAVTLGEALAAEQLLRQVDAVLPAERAAFIRDHRAELNQALMIRQIVVAIGHTVEVTSLVAERLYHRPLLCGIAAPVQDDDGDTEAGAGNKPSLPDLARMGAAFKVSLRRALHLADTPDSDARLDKIDVTDVIANQMVEEKKCDQN
jgi:hypothetical protein